MCSYYYYYVAKFTPNTWRQIQSKEINFFLVSPELGGYKYFAYCQEDRQFLENAGKYNFFILILTVKFILAPIVIYLIIITCPKFLTK